MKKYARLRSSSSLDPEQYGPCHGGKPEGASTILSLDEDDDVNTSTPGKWSSPKLSPPALQGSKHNRGGDVSSSSSRRVLAEALKKLSSLKETHHDIEDPVPRGVMSATPSWGGRIVSDSDASSGESHSTFSGNWLRPRSAMGADTQGSSDRSGSNGDAVSAISQEIIQSESSCTHTSHFTHRRSSSLHDGITLGGQPSVARPSATSMAAMAISELHTRQPGIKAGFVPCFHADSEQWMPPPLRINSTSASTSGASAAAGPSARQVPMVAAHSLRQAKSCSLWEENDGPKGWGPERSAAKRAGVVQSMRYDRLQSNGAGAGLREKELQSQSVREGAAHAQAIAAMARAYAEKYGVAQAVVECLSCGRGLGVIVEGTNPGSYDSSFCRACRPPALPAATATATATAATAPTSWKKGASGVSRGMMHYCRKLLLRMSKKPAHKYTMV